MNISIKIEGIEAVRRTLNALEKNQLPYATALALTRTAQDAKKDLEAEIKRVFDRPTPYTLNSLYVKPATKATLMAMVYLREFAGKGTPATKYMSPNIFGQDRNVKRFERALQRIGILPAGMYIAPGEGADMDAWGNLSRGQIVQVLSYFQAFGEQGYKANMAAAGKARLLKGSRRKGTLGYAYFVARQGGHLKPGIYKRVGFSKGSAIKPIMMFVRKPVYRSIFRFYQIAQKTIDRVWQQNFSAAFQEAMRTAK